jgi:hypothetical protein
MIFFYFLPLDKSWNLRGYGQHFFYLSYWLSITMLMLISFDTGSIYIYQWFQYRTIHDTNRTVRYDSSGQRCELLLYIGWLRNRRNHCNTVARYAYRTLSSNTAILYYPIKSSRFSDSPVYDEIGHKWFMKSRCGFHLESQTSLIKMGDEIICASWNIRRLEASLDYGDHCQDLTLQ